SARKDKTREHLLPVRDRFQRQGNPAEGIHADLRVEPTLVKIEGLTKSFGGHCIFKNLTLEFPRGELSVVMGPSGCGKSTLLRCINFLAMFDSGRISIGGMSVEWTENETAALSPEKKTALQQM